MRRAGGILTAVLVLATVALPGVLTAAAQASTVQLARNSGAAQPVGSPVRLVITSMSPRWASPGSAIRVTGKLTNVSADPINGLAVQLNVSGTAVSNLTELQQDEVLGSDTPASQPGVVSQALGRLRPGATVRWSVRVPAAQIGARAFGVYPVTAQVDSAAGIALSPLTTSGTFLPYEPPRRGPDASTRPVRQKIAWVWPLMDNPLLGSPWQGSCTGQPVDALVTSFSSGRLAGLLTAGRAFTSQDHLTWAVDPALLANVQALASSCQQIAPALAKAASRWLAEIKSATAGQQLFVTPYANVNMAALFGQNRDEDVKRAFQQGRLVAGAILRRNVTPPAVGAKPGTAGQIAGMAWPAGGIASYAILENLAAKDDVRTMLLDSSMMPDAPSTVTRSSDGEGGYVRVLLSDDALTHLLGSASNAPGSAFATAQGYLAQTAVMASLDPHQSAAIVAAPPQMWQPPAGLAASLLADTARAPWLSPVSLASLAAVKSPPVQSLQPPDAAAGPGLSRHVLSELATLDRDIAQLESIQVRPDPSLYLAVATVESSAWQGKASGSTTPLLAGMKKYLDGQQKKLQIIADARVTLGGLKGKVPVSIDNQLGYPIRVRLRLTVSAPPSGIVKVTYQKNVLTIPARTQLLTELHVQATQAGSTSITVQLVSPAGKSISGIPVTMTVQATHFGTLAMIILAAALGIFVITSAARAIRRGRPAPAEGPPPGGSAEDSAGSGEVMPGDDSVAHERTEIRTAGTSGL